MRLFSGCRAWPKLIFFARAEIRTLNAETAHYVVDELYPSGIKALLGRGEDLSEDQFETYNDFIQSYLQFFVNDAADHDSVNALDALATIFDGQAEF